MNDEAEMIIDVLRAKENQVADAKIDFPFIRIGDKVVVKDSNGQEYKDIVRDAFWQTTLVQPYGPNETFPALVLTQRSWCRLSDVVGLVLWEMQ